MTHLKDRQTHRQTAQRLATRGVSKPQETNLSRVNLSSSMFKKSYPKYMFLVIPDARGRAAGPRYQRVCYFFMYLSWQLDW
jgi:hypothetical protein